MAATSCWEQVASTTPRSPALHLCEGFNHISSSSSPPSFAPRVTITVYGLWKRSWNHAWTGCVDLSNTCPRPAASLATSTDLLTSFPPPHAPLKEAGSPVRSLGLTSSASRLQHWSHRRRRPPSLGASWLFSLALLFLLCSSGFDLLSSHRRAAAPCSPGHHPLTAWGRRSQRG